MNNSLNKESLDSVMRKYDKESNTRIWVGAPKKIIDFILVSFSVFCIYMALFSTMLPEKRLSLFLGLIIICGYLLFPASKNNIKINHLPFYDILLMALGFLSFFFFTINSLDIIMLATRILPIHIFFGICGILVLAELCRRCVGIPIICVVGVLIVYTFYNQYLHGASFPMALRNIIYKLFYTTSGIIGTPVNVCYTYIVLFIIFGAFLEKTGIADYFISLANRLAGRYSGGPAKVAVISSALCGMVSGSSVGNTVTTGSVTIPMMKKTGCKNEFAGAVEASASTGGQIMPPIMGAAAFLMAEYTGLPYSQVALKAILPALLYFFGIFVSVHIEAKKNNLKGIPINKLPKVKYLIKNIYLIIPLAFLIILVATGTKTMAVSASLSIIAAIIISFINVLLNNSKEEYVLKKSVTKTLTSVFEALKAGASGAITVAVACSMAGMIAGCITVTGLASTLINVIISVAGNTKIIGLLLTMVCCIILGMGVPTTANYCIMASTCAPILVQLGFNPIASHFFVFYFGIIADITPPVALAAYAGSAIAESKPIKTAITASKLAIAAFVVPYIFAYSPEMLFIGNNISFLTVIQVSLSAIIGLFAITSALNGFLIKNMNPVFRIISACGGLCMMIPGTITDLIGLIIISLIVIFQYFTKSKHFSKEL